MNFIIIDLLYQPIYLLYQPTYLPTYLPDNLSAYVYFFLS